jgi:hypothetical protein
MPARPDWSGVRWRRGDGGPLCPAVCCSSTRLNRLTTCATVPPPRPRERQAEESWLAWGLLQACGHVGSGSAEAACPEHRATVVEVYSGNGNGQHIRTERRPGRAEHVDRNPDWWRTRRPAVLIQSAHPSSAGPRRRPACVWKFPRVKCEGRRNPQPGGRMDGRRLSHSAVVVLVPGCAAAWHMDGRQLVSVEMGLDQRERPADYGRQGARSENLITRGTMLAGPRPPRSAMPCSAPGITACAFRRRSDRWGRTR